MSIDLKAEVERAEFLDWIDEEEFLFNSRKINEDAEDLNEDGEK